MIRIDKVCFLHLRYYVDDQLQPKGGATIAFRVIKEEEDTYTLEMGLAQCRITDHFCKRIGRDISMARLFQNKWPVVEYFQYHPTWKQIIKEVKETFYLEKEEFVPTIRTMYK